MQRARLLGCLVCCRLCLGGRFVGRFDLEGWFLFSLLIVAGWWNGESDLV